jgi:transposase-like protein
MAMNRIQFQKGLSMPDFIKQFGNESQCESALEQARWAAGFVCPCCGDAGYSTFRVGSLKMFQCKSCRHQSSLIAGTLFQHTKLPLTVWFLAIYLISQAKTGLSALALKRYLGVSYPTAWLINHKLMQAMSERDDQYVLIGKVDIDDAYLGGELSGGKAGRGSENKVPFVAALSFDENGQPLYLKLTPVTGFTSAAIADWAKTHLDANCSVLSDGLACFAAVTQAGCQHEAIIARGRKPKEMLEFLWLNTVLGNLKTSLAGAYHAFGFAKYASRYLAAFAYRFNRRFQLDKLPERLLGAAVTTAPRTLKWLRSPAAEAAC